MAEYYMPWRKPSSMPSLYNDLYGLRYVRTYGRRRPPKIDPWERIAKKKLNNPMLWAQLDTVSKGTFINHLGRRHTRRVEDHPYFR